MSENVIQTTFEHDLFFLIPSFPVHKDLFLRARVNENEDTLAAGMI
jgi:hypothetical protein